jgi:hypothetical protein
MILQAWDQGLLLHDMPGWMKLKVLENHIRHTPPAGRNRSYRYFHGCLFIFDSESKSLITVYPVANDDDTVGWLND